MGINRSADFRGIASDGAVLSVVIKEFAEVKEVAEGEEGEVVKFSSISLLFTVFEHLLSGLLLATCLTRVFLVEFLTSETLLPSSDKISINFCLFSLFLDAFYAFFLLWAVVKLLAGVLFPFAMTF